MRVDVNPNLLSGAYAVTEVLLILVLTRALKLLVGLWNVKRIYDDKCKPKLCAPPAYVVMNFGITTREAHFFAMVVTSILVVLTTIGSFAISGVTVNKVRKEAVKNLVKVAAPDSRVDFRKHISFDRREISGTVLLLLSNNFCRKHYESSSLNFEYKNDLVELDNPTIPVSNQLPNSTCLVEENKYVEKETFRIRHWDKHYHVNEKCIWRVEVNAVAIGVPTRILGINTSEACPFQILETWCFRHSVISCVASVQYDTFFSLSARIHHPTGESSVVYGTLQVEEPVVAELLTSMAMLFEVRPLSLTEVDQILIAVSLTVETDDQIEKVTGERDVVELNLRLLIGTMGTVLALVVIIGMVTLTLYVKILVLPERISWNRFNSPMELLTYETFGVLEQGGSGSDICENVETAGGESAFKIPGGHSNTQAKIAFG